jgi:hypothetical protein
LESVLGATPREFESRILRHLTCKNVSSWQPVPEPFMVCGLVRK